MPYNFVADSFHTKKLCSSFKQNAILDGKMAVLRLEPPFAGGGGLRDNNIRCSSWAHWKARISLDVTAEALRAKIDRILAISL